MALFHGGGGDTNRVEGGTQTEWRGGGDTNRVGEGGGGAVPPIHLRLEL